MLHFAVVPRISRWVLLLSVAWGLVACGPSPAISTATPFEPQAVDQGDGAPTTESRREEVTMTPTSTPEAPNVELPAGAEQIVRLAQEDLAQRLNLASEAIRPVSVEAVEWPDASLGCPQPGMMYAQVITPGFRVVLEAEGQTYEYHTDAGRFVVLCEQDW